MPSSSGGRLALGVIVLVLLVAVVGALWWTVVRDPNPTSAALGDEGTRTFEGVPDDLPAGVVPADAVEVEGTVARSGDDWTSAVTFVVDGERDDVIPTVDEAILADGFALRQRAYDDEVMQVIYDGPDGSVLTVTYRTIPQGTGTAVVLVSP